MCAINGIFAFQPAAREPSAAELLATRDHMRARGPDGFGEWWSTDRRCAFGHRRLSIIDLSDRAAQPMVSGDGRYVITFNGEIYNHAELRAGLIARGATFRTSSDTEVILELFAREGAAMVSRLRGMFAFAIWDGVRRSLFLARDAYGIKPLYVANDGWTFRFASQVKALLAGGGVSHDPEPAGAAGFQIFGSVPEPFTFWREIRALPAGHMQTVDEFGPQPARPFTTIARTLAAGAQTHAQASDWYAQARSALLDSVRAHLVADVDIGVFLSAGVDSGAILGLIRDCGREGIPAITLAFDEFRGTAEDEAPIAARVAALYGARHIVRRVSRREFSECLPEIFAAMDQPSIDGVNTWFVSKATREAGLKVAISGLGGDELFAGYPSFAQVPVWRRYLGPLAAVPGAGRISRTLLQWTAPGLARRNPKALGMLRYAGSWQGAYLLRRALNLPEDVTQLERDLLREGLRRLQPLKLLRQCITPDPGSATGRVCALESAHYMRNQLLRDSDWAGMAHGVEIRLPLVDIFLLKEIAPFVPGFRPGAGKAALATAPQIALPAEILKRKKTGFGVPTGEWLPDGAPRMALARKGAASRRWSTVVLNRIHSPVGAA